MFTVRANNGWLAFDAIVQYWKTLYAPQAAQQTLLQVFLSLWKDFRYVQAICAEKSTMGMPSNLYSFTGRHLHSCHPAELAPYVFLPVLADLEHCAVIHGHTGKVHAFYVIKIYKIGLVYPYKTNISA